MSEVRRYSVQQFSRDDDGGLRLAPAVTHVIAETAQEAASRVMGEDLFLIGEPQSVKAKIWFTDDNGRPLVTMLYGRPATS